MPAVRLPCRRHPPRLYRPSLEHWADLPTYRFPSLSTPDSYLADLLASLTPFFSALCVHSSFSSFPSPSRPRPVPVDLRFRPIRSSRLGVLTPPPILCILVHRHRRPRHLVPPTPLFSSPCHTGHLSPLLLLTSLSSPPLPSLVSSLFRKPWGLLHFLIFSVPPSFTHTWLLLFYSTIHPSTAFPKSPHLPPNHTL